MPEAPFSLGRPAPLTLHATRRVRAMMRLQNFGFPQPFASDQLEPSTGAIQ